MPKTTPVVATPDTHCNFDDYTTTPQPISRFDAARALKHIRLAASYGNAQLQRLGAGKYKLIALNILVLSTR